MHRTLTSVVVLVSAVPLCAETTCERLAQTAIPGAVITLTAPIAAGAFKTPEQPGGAFNSPTLQVRPFCRVTATLHPTGDSSIDVEVWLPEDWKGKYQAVGGGGWAGVISYAALAAALSEGYATSSTDTGHKGPNAEFAPGHPEKLIDFGYRAVHEMTVAAKIIINARYGRAPRLSYWNGCSTGGRQGLQEAQRYPSDYDAILAGAPANYHLHLNAWDMKTALVNQKDEAHLVPANKLALLHRAVLEKCDRLDAVSDGLLNDPRSCSFDPSALLCKGSDTTSCLTAPQLESVRAMYAPAKSRDGALIYPGMVHVAFQRTLTCSRGAIRHPGFDHPLRRRTDGVLSRTLPRHRPRWYRDTLASGQRRKEAHPSQTPSLGRTRTRTAGFFSFRAISYDRVYMAFATGH